MSKVWDDTVLVFLKKFHFIFSWMGPQIYMGPWGRAQNGNWQLNPQSVDAVIYFLEKMDTENQLQITVTIQIYPLRKYLWWESLPFIPNFLTFQAFQDLHLKIVPLSY